MKLSSTSLLLCLCRSWVFLLVPLLLSTAQGADPLPKSDDTKSRLKSAKLVLVGEIKGDKNNLDLAIVSIYKGPQNPRDSALFKKFVPAILLSGLYSTGVKILLLCGGGQFGLDQAKDTDAHAWDVVKRIHNDQVREIDPVAGTITLISLDEIRRMSKENE